MRKYQRQVAAGIALLDKMRPGWRRKLDLAALDMVECDRCVLGQVFGSYLEGVNQMETFLGWDGTGPDEGDSADFGFSLSEGGLYRIVALAEDARQWKLLRKEWLRQLRPAKPAHVKPARALARV